LGSFVEDTNDKLSHLGRKMKSFSSKPEANQIVEIAASDRWQVYRRLQELAIPCQCGTNQPLTVQINDVATAIQLWSVVRQLTVPRCELAFWLEHCWKVRG
jgi:hypothetical protein